MCYTCGMTNTETTVHLITRGYYEEVEVIEVLVGTEEQAQVRVEQLNTATCRALGSRWDKREYGVSYGGTAPLTYANDTNREA